MSHKTFSFGPVHLRSGRSVATQRSLALAALLVFIFGANAAVLGPGAHSHPTSSGDSKHASHDDCPVCIHLQIAGGALPSSHLLLSGLVELERTEPPPPCSIAVQAQHRPCAARAPPA